MRQKIFCNKAAECHGLYAEHFKLALALAQVLMQFLCIT